MRAVAYLFFYAMNVGLVLLGALGLLAPRRDFRDQLKIASLDPLGTDAQRTLLVQYRYLKGFAFAVGLTGLLLRDEIFTNPAANRMYLAALGFAALGRVVGLLRDGVPNRLLAFVIIPFEILTPIVIWLYSRQTLVGG